MEQGQIIGGRTTCRLKWSQKTTAFFLLQLTEFGRAWGKDLVMEQPDCCLMQASWPTCPNDAVGDGKNIRLATAQTDPMDTIRQPGVCVRLGT